MRDGGTFGMKVEMLRSVQWNQRMLHSRNTALDSCIGHAAHLTLPTGKLTCLTSFVTTTCHDLCDTHRGRWH
ncbi:hypothetical protein SAMN06265222_101344 [Neorhodopirellula lusitana]|uniref:Uncharacterized protein n=1 Tax=Neorhodopirellula lusitana TaxID=445327 RepID=A0ABY1PNM0_9BACT|nr:hypothetical protein SAMN06265222_101344 [Neorhodopirellula lusitana]